MSTTERHTLTLTDFLLARIAEDDDDAAVYVNGRGEAARWTCDEVGGAVRSRSGVVVRAETHMDAVHIARHDPARVLAECAAKRRLIESDPVGDVRRIIATEVYSDHPDFNPAWSLGRGQDEHH